MRDRHLAALLSIFEDPHDFSGALDVQCPVCGQNSKAKWSRFIAETDSGITELFLPAVGESRLNIVTLEWMHCANEECEQLLIQVNENRDTGRITGGGPLIERRTWFARPQFSSASRELSELVKDPYRRDYVEAAAIIEMSPRMAAVLARKIVADLLEDHAGISEYTLKTSLDKFIADESHPVRIREHLQHLREIGDFGAHTKKDSTGQVIEVSRDDANWTLALVDRLFEYFIIDPSRDHQLRAKWDVNLQQAGRKVIPPVVSDPEVPSP